MTTAAERIYDDVARRIASRYSPKIAFARETPSVLGQIVFSIVIDEANFAGADWQMRPPVHPKFRMRPFSKKVRRALLQRRDLFDLLKKNPFNESVRDIVRMKIMSRKRVKIAKSAMQVRSKRRWLEARQQLYEIDRRIDEMIQMDVVTLLGLVSL